MLELTITSAPAVKPQILLQRSIAWPGYTTASIIGKAPRSLICCNATASWLFGERSFRPSCLRWASHQQKKLSASGACWFWVLGLAWQVCEGDRAFTVVMAHTYNDVITMISGFLTSVIQFPPTTPTYRGTPYVDYWFLPSSTPAF